MYEASDLLPSELWQYILSFNFEPRASKHELISLITTKRLVCKLFYHVFNDRIFWKSLIHPFEYQLAERLYLSTPNQLEPGLPLGVAVAVTLGFLLATESEPASFPFVEHSGKRFSRASNKIHAQHPYTWFISGPKLRRKIAKIAKSPEEVLRKTHATKLPVLRLESREYIKDKKSIYVRFEGHYDPLWDGNCFDMMRTRQSFGPLLSVDRETLEIKDTHFEHYPVVLCQLASDDELAKMTQYIMTRCVNKKRKPLDIWLNFPEEHPQRGGVLLLEGSTAPPHSSLSHHDLPKAIQPDFNMFSLKEALQDIGYHQVVGYLAHRHQHSDDFRFAIMPVGNWGLSQPCTSFIVQPIHLFLCKSSGSPKSITIFRTALQSLDASPHCHTVKAVQLQGGSLSGDQQSSIFPPLTDVWNRKKEKTLKLLLEQCISIIYILLIKYIEQAKQQEIYERMQPILHDLFRYINQAPDFWLSPRMLDLQRHMTDLVSGLDAHKAYINQLHQLIDEGTHESSCDFPEWILHGRIFSLLSTKCNYEYKHRKILPHSLQEITYICLRLCDEIRAINLTLSTP